MLGITLARKNFRENDQIVALYTKEAGKMEAVARGIKKIISKNSSALEPFSVLEFETVPGKERSYITKVFAVKSYTAIREHPGKMILGGHVLELIDRSILSGVKDEKLFKLVRSLLQEIDESNTPNFLLWPALLLKFWGHLGFAPILQRCVVCGKDNDLNLFDIPHGGVVCLKCGNAGKLPPIDPGMIRGMKFLIKKPWKDIQDLKLSFADSTKLFGLVKNFVEYHAGIRPPNQIYFLRKLFFDKTIK